MEAPFKAMFLCFCAFPRMPRQHSRGKIVHICPFRGYSSYSARIYSCTEVLWGPAEVYGKDEEGVKSLEAECSSPSLNKRVKKAVDASRGKKSISRRTLAEEEENWKEGEGLWVLALLKRYRIPDEIVNIVMRRVGLKEILRWEVGEVESVLVTMNELGLQGDLLVRVVKRRPDLLGNLVCVKEAVNMLRDIGMTSRDIREVLLKWPGLMVADVDKMKSVIEVLCDDDIGFKVKELRPLVRKASWILMYDVDTDMRPLIRGMREWIGSQGIKKIVQGAPQVFGIEQQTIDDVVGFLMHTIGLDDNEVAAVLRSCPILLTCSVQVCMVPAMNYLRSLSIDSDSLRKIVRAFPAILLLDVEREMMCVVEYFRQRGIVDVGLIITRLPPILSYDLQFDVEPKMEYLEKNLGLTVFDVLRFPAYFSYSLKDIIIPRTAFLKAIGKKIVDVGLIRAIGFREQEFCRRVAKVPFSRYTSFAEALKSRLEQTEIAAVSLSNKSLIPPQGEVAKQPAGLSNEVTLRKRKRRKERRRRHMICRIPWQEIS